ncbi:NAD(P)H-binding protein [Haloterrigena alkaliphila]|uniref:NAD(P)H-binding protein n=1 Tax=Haloterrigena alkaliphila TaxID=2816475 RepID=UPI001CED6BA9|nr:NAD(P)H-binding protein [Haloterrigena alkaliphila]UHQ95043.1 NAD(P)H-binding protein [Haloterrigena alkaliphila]
MRGRTGQRIAAELLEHEHAVTGVSRSGELGLDPPEFESVAGDMTAPDALAQLVVGHDVVASALGPGENPDVDVPTDLVEGFVEGLRRTDIYRLLGRRCRQPRDRSGDDADRDRRVPGRPRSPRQAHLEALASIRDADALERSSLVPAADRTRRAHE